jgi:hypothetical protein
MLGVEVNTGELKAFTKKLRELHRSNLPIVVRQALNNTAFDVLKNTLPSKFSGEFIIRNRSFLRSHTGVEKADGWNINEMRSKVGITPKGSEAAENLTKQEYGGSEKRPFIYMDQSRVSGSNQKVVKTANYVQNKNFLKGSPTKQKTQKSQFVANAIEAKNNNLSFLKNDILFDVKSIRLVRGRVEIKLTPIASYKKNRSININPHHFLMYASLESYKKLSGFYIEAAKKRFEKALKK